MTPERVARGVVRRARRWARRVSGAVRRRATLLLDPPDGERALRRRLRAEGAGSSPRLPDGRWHAWVNRALRTSAEVDAACEAATDAGLPLHGERTKNWDYLTALGSIVEHVGPKPAILEMGAPQYSRLLHWLFLLGYRDLRGIDLVYTAPVRAGPIRYEPMDLTRTTFPDASFDAVACLSVIEHGVDLEAYVREAARILRPGGILVTSTDFWCEPVDTGGQVAYGTPIRIFTPPDIERLAGLAAAHGLRLRRPLELACDERVVEWRRFGLRYTFLNLVLVKDAAPR